MYEFMNTHVCCFKNYREVPVHFVGSIAFYFEPILRRIAANLNINIGKITNKPVEGLVQYHLEKLKGK
jgi:glucosamine kinase